MPAHYMAGRFMLGMHRGLLPCGSGRRPAVTPEPRGEGAGLYRPPPRQL